MCTLPLASESLVMAKDSHTFSQSPQLLHLFRFIFTTKGLKRPIIALAGKRGQIRLQKSLFLVRRGPTMRKIRPPPTKIRADIHSTVVLTAGGS